ncbi:MAG: GGDEF domain-containing phosphodiesterase [Lachnospiraceae bacterium]|nr:GGDEF domain-containing phosphodiesterase [Lachnospiraceae bacterium]
MDRSQYSNEKTRADEYDTLTGLPGMNRFFGRAESQRQALIEQGEDPALIYFDLNGMKEFNIRDSMEAVGAGLACDRARLACDQGRDSLTSGYYYFSERLLEEARQKQYIIDHLDQAIEEHWIQVYYQPLIRSANGRVCDEEALARWIDPEKGFLSPADFIPILENTGLIYKLDLYITEQILAKMKLLREKGLFAVPTSINISRSDFAACDVVEEIRKRVDAAGIAHEMITIEITESILGNDLDYMKQQVDRFHALGFQVWMDDYGSGYSSPDILMTIPFDTIKLDMQFIRQYEKNKASGIIISGLIKMAMGLGIETVVEGVETEEQAEFLKEVGCTKLQGYLYCKPIPLGEILRRYDDSPQIGFEDPAELAYFSAIGKVNLYDLSIAVDDEEQQFRDYFDTMPMAIVEVGGEEIALTRCNKSYRSFVGNHYPVSAAKGRAKITDLLTGSAASLVRIVIKCAKDGRQVLTDMKTATSSSPSAMWMRRCGSRRR